MKIVELLKGIVSSTSVNPAASPALEYQLSSSRSACSDCMTLASADLLLLVDISAQSSVHNESIITYQASFSRTKGTS